MKDDGEDEDYFQEFNTVTPELVFAKFKPTCQTQVIKAEEPSAEKKDNPTKKEEFYN